MKYILASLVFLITAQPLTAAPHIIDKVIAKVDQEAITKSELKNKRRQLPKNIKKFSDQEVLELMILERLILIESSLNKISVGEQELAKYLELVASQEKMDSQQFLRYQAKVGISKEMLMQQLKMEILKQKLISKLFQNSVDVSNQEIEKFISNNPQLTQTGNKVKLRQIFIGKKGKSHDKLSQIKNEILRKLKAGENFSELASKHSESPDGKSGGLIGIISEEDLSSEFFDALLTLNPGEYSKAVETDTGFHIFLLEQRFTNQGNDQEKLNAFVKAEIKKQKLQQKLAIYFRDEIYKNHVIERDL